MRLSLKVGVAGLLLTGVLVSVAAGGDASSAPEKLNDEAGIVRLIVAAEEAYLHANGRYATSAELLKSESLQHTANQASQHLRALQTLNLQSETQPVAGFTLKVVVAPDGAHYKMSLTREDQPCAAGWFSDDGGIVYEGKAVDCAPGGTAATRSAQRGWGPLDIDEAVPPVRTDAPCPLPQILEETGKRAQEFAENLQRFSASDRIEHLELGKNGETRKSTSQVMNYVALIEQNSGYPIIEEHREGSTAIQDAPLTDTGTAAFALIFHPAYAGNFNFRCEGLAEMRGSPAWQMHFEEGSDPTKSFHAIRIGPSSTYLLRFKGRAWIAADDYEVLRIETDLVSPIPQIDLRVEHLAITYAPVEFQKRHVRLWLPESASLYVGYRGHRYERVHNFSQFQLFWVEADQTVKDPIAGKGTQPE